MDIQKNAKTNQLLILHHNVLPTMHDNDHNMTDSSSPTNNKTGQLVIQLIHQKRTRNDLQAEHSKYADQSLWLGFQTMEVIAMENNTPSHEVRTTIRELIKLGFKENEVVELHTAKISFSIIQQQRWPSLQLDGRSNHHFHLTQVPSNTEINVETGFSLVYHIMLNFKKLTTSHEIIEMTKTRFHKMGIELGELREPIAPLCNSKNDT